MLPLVALTAIVLGVAACGGGESEGDSDDAVVFGADAELSGPLQVYAAPGEQGLEQAAEDINDEGGIEVGDQSLTAEVAIEDNRSDPSQVVSAARAVIDSGSIAAWGPGISGAAAYELWEKVGLITFTPDFNLQETLRKDPQGNPLLFTQVPFYYELYPANMLRIKELFPEISKVAIVAPSDDQGLGGLAAYEAGAKVAGMSVVAGEVYEPDAVDFSSVLTSIKGKSPDLLIALVSPEQASNILRQATQLDVAPYGLSDTMTADQALELTSDGAGLTMIIPNFSPTFSEAATIPDFDPEAIFGDEQPAGAPGAGIVMYYAYRVVAQAITDAGTATDAEAIARELPGQSYDGPFGTCKVSRQHALDCETTVDVVEGDLVTVNRYPTSKDIQPSAVYECREGNCKAD